MRKVVVLLTVLLVLLSGCSKTPAPELALTKMMDRLVETKISKAEKLTIEGSLHLKRKNKHAKKIYKALFSSMSYSISGSSVYEDAAEVVVTVTTIDMKAVVAEASLEVLETAMDSFFPDNKKLYKLVAEKVELGNFEYTTETVLVYMVKENGKWKVDMAGSRQFADAITGGLGELMGS